ncbi:MAG: hypothetical protein QXD69_04570, partial [Candidatus Bathyarchaeia archaeon]
TEIKTHLFKKTPKENTHQNLKNPTKTKYNSAINHGENYRGLQKSNRKIQILKKNPSKIRLNIEFNKPHTPSQIQQPLTNQHLYEYMPTSRHIDTIH